MNSISLTINQQAVTAAAGSSILEAARSAGITIPTLCFNKWLKKKGSCWMCIVEIKGKNRFVPACETPASDGMVIETENETLSAMRRQSLERIIAEHNGDCLGPCERTCPAGCDIPSFIAAIASGNDDEAIRIIKETIPLPAILGRICPAPCETECRRHGVDEPLSICALKRYAADKDSEKAESYVPALAASSGKHVAIVGSGPAGLTAAWFLLRNGHAVTIIESASQAGGMMRYGIPRFRLPEEVIESDIAPLRAMGVQFRFNTKFGSDITLDDLQEEFDAVLLAVGAQQAAIMQIAGEEVEGVMSGIEFLRNVALGKQQSIGKRVIVTGGGNTAIDAARTARRCGADEVTILYRRSRKEMPANHQEIHEALAEGIQLREWSAPLAIREENGALALTAIAMQAGEVDSSGRRKPVPIEGSEFTLIADTIISAIGQQIEAATAQAATIPTGRSGELTVHPETLQAVNTPWLFACGDCVTGTDTAIRAVAQGNHAAHAINLFLQGKAVTPPTKLFNSSYGARDAAPAAFYQKKSPAPRLTIPELSIAERISNFDEVVIGYTTEQARTEAARCLECQCNTLSDCRLRALASRYITTPITQKHEHAGFYKAANSTIVMEREKCVDCGICVRMLEEQSNNVNLQIMTISCPTGALSLPV